jgi:hypothetical protein
MRHRWPVLVFHPSPKPQRTLRPRNDLDLEQLVVHPVHTSFDTCLVRLSDLVRSCEEGHAELPREIRPPHGSFGPTLGEINPAVAETDPRSELRRRRWIKSQRAHVLGVTEASAGRTRTAHTSSCRGVLKHDRYESCRLTRSVCRRRLGILSELEVLVERCQPEEVLHGLRRMCQQHVRSPSWDRFWARRRARTPLESMNVSGRAGPPRFCCRPRLEMMKSRSTSSHAALSNSPSRRTRYSPVVSEVSKEGQGALPPCAQSGRRLA